MCGLKSVTIFCCVAIAIYMATFGKKVWLYFAFGEKNKIIISKAF
jgi:hypothetical protein